jgi:hypothetical protein
MADTTVDRSRYWATLPLDEALPAIDERTQSYYDVLRSSRTFDLWRAVHSALYSGIRTGGQLGVDGDAGELTTIELNEVGNLYAHILNLITAQRPEFEAQATNTDHKAQSQTIIGKAVVDYAMRERGLEGVLEKAAGFMLKYAEGWVLPLWNALAGPDYRPDPETNVVMKCGDMEYVALTPPDVARDTYAESALTSSWYTARTWANRYDIMARYPELREQIAVLPSKYETEDQRPRIAGRAWNQTATLTAAFRESDEIPVYTWMHRKSDALPEGRMVIYVSPEVALYDGALPYRDIPLHRMAAQDVDGTTAGYSCLYDILAPQAGMNAVASTIVSNQAAFGVQNIWVPTGSNLTWKSLRGGLNLVEGGTTPPQALNLLATKEETFRLFELLRACMERYSGINSTVRGNPEANLKSGAALALVYAQTIQFIALTQRAYTQAAEKVGTATIHGYQDFGQAERVVSIAGESNRPYSLSFSARDLDQIERVSVRMSNPLMGTIAGRYNFAEMLLERGLLDDPKQVMEVVTSGRLEPTMESPIRERMNIRSENERLSRGEPVIAIFADNPLKHIAEHLTVLASPEARESPEIVAAAQAHIQQHVELWHTTAPEVLAACGVPPPPIGGPMPGEPPPGGPGGPPPGGPGKAPPPPMPGMGNAPALGLEQPSMPAMPRNPVTGEPPPMPAMGGM